MEKLSINEPMRGAVDSAINALEILSFAAGWEAAASVLEEWSQIKKDENDPVAADLFQWGANELRDANA